MVNGGRRSEGRRSRKRDLRTEPMMGKRDLLEGLRAGHLTGRVKRDARLRIALDAHRVSQGFHYRDGVAALVRQSHNASSGGERHVGRTPGSPGGKPSLSRGACNPSQPWPRSPTLSARRPGYAAYAAATDAHHRSLKTTKAC